MIIALFLRRFDWLTFDYIFSLFSTFWFLHGLLIFLWSKNYNTLKCLSAYAKMFICSVAKTCRVLCRPIFLIKGQSWLIHFRSKLFVNSHIYLTWNFLKASKSVTSIFRRISATLSCPMSLEKYPLDVQSCPIMFESCECNFFGVFSRIHGRTQASFVWSE